MNLQGKINVIKDAKDSIKSAIIAKGITPTGNISTYADAIDNIVTPNNQTKTVTENGVVRYDTGYTGLGQVTVSLPLNSKSITTNGTYNASADNLQGYNSVTVNVQPDVDTKTITANGTYNASSDNLDGYDEVIVNVPNPINDLIDGSITEVDTNVSTIKSGAFKDCEDLDTVVLRSNTVVDLSDDSIFENTPIEDKTGNIYVPSSLLDSYKSNNKSNNPNNFVEATQNSNLDSSLFWDSFVFGNNKFVAVSAEGYVSISEDGNTWGTSFRGIYSSDLNNNWQGLTYDGSKFIALSNRGYISTSTDGTTWTSPTQVNNLGSRDWCALIYDGSKIVALSSGAYISTSTDGTTWTSATKVNSLTDNLNAPRWTALTYDGTKFIALEANDGYTAISFDGTTWMRTGSSLGGASSWLAITYNNEIFIALSMNGYISTSIDGVTWASPTLNTNLGSHSWLTIISTDGLYALYALGSRGYISYTDSKYNFLPIHNAKIEI